MPKLGHRDCQPVGDCTRAWPPANATHFVDANGPEDATHFRSIQQAIMAQRSDDAVIAIAPGTYVESLQPVRPMTIVGRCAEHVVVQSPGGNTSGLRLRSVRVTLEGVTLQGQYTGVAIDSGGKLTLRDSVLVANREVGVTVAHAHSSLLVERTVIRSTTSANALFGRGVQVQAGALAVIRDSAVLGNQSFGVFVTDASSKVELADSIVAGTLPSSRGGYGIGLSTNEGGSAEVRRSAFVANRDRNVMFAGGTASIFDSVVRAATPTPGTLTGFGLIAQDGAQVRVERTTFSSSSEAGVGSNGEGTSVTLIDSVVRDNRFLGNDATAVGARLGGKMQISGTALVDNQHRAMHSVEGGQMVIERSLIQGTVSASTAKESRAVEVFKGCASFTNVSIVRNSMLGVLVGEATCPVTMDRVLLGQTIPKPNGRRGWGVSVQNSQLVMQNSALFDNCEVGLFVYGSARVSVNQSSVSGTQKTSDGYYGIGLFGLAGTFTQVTHTDVRDSQGVGLFFDGASATVFDSFVSNNVIGLHTQHGSVLKVEASAPAVPAALVVSVGESTQFNGNESRLGSGEYPVPDPF